MSSSANEADSDQILFKICQEINEDDRFLNKAQAYFDRAGEFLESGNFRLILVCFLKIVLYR